MCSKSVNNFIFTCAAEASFRTVSVRLQVLKSSPLQILSFSELIKISELSLRLSYPQEEYIRSRLSYVFEAATMIRFGESPLIRISFMFVFRLARFSAVKIIDLANLRFTREDFLLFCQKICKSTHPGCKWNSEESQMSVPTRRRSCVTNILDEENENEHLLDRIEVKHLRPLSP